jgi:hypothetical protein
LYCSVCWDICVVEAGQEVAANILAQYHKHSNTFEQSSHAGCLPHTPDGQLLASSSTSVAGQQQLTAIKPAATAAAAAAAAFEWQTCSSVKHRVMSQHTYQHGMHADGAGINTHMLHMSTTDACDSLSNTSLQKHRTHACLLVLHLPDTAVGVATVVEHCCCDWVQP